MPESRSTSPRAGRFCSTRWSVIACAQAQDPARAREAIEELCKTYWYPLYAFIRGEGYRLHDAEDLTQQFFARFLEKDYVHDVDRSKGRFRSFLLASLRHFLANEWKRSHAKKRGGMIGFVPLESEHSEIRYLREPVDRMSPDRLYDRRWALTLLQRVVSRLRQDFASAGRGAFFECLKPTLTASSLAPSYAEIGRRFGLNENAVKVAVHRLRRRYRRRLRAEVARTVSSPDQVDQELRHLLAALES